MSVSTHLSCNDLPGYIMSDGHRLLRSGVSARTIAVCPYTFHANQRIRSHVMIGSLKFETKKASLFVCESTSGGRRRNPDFSRQHRQVFRRGDRQNEQRDSNSFFEADNETETLSSRNGSLLSSLSNSEKFQATAAPGPREKEIVELFKKVQAKLRERAAAKEEKKVEEASAERGKESETVNSLLKLLRKHSGEQGKRKSGSFNRRDFGSDQIEENGAYVEEIQSTRFSESQGKRMDETEEINNNASSLARPASVFRRKSPVPQFRPQPILSDENGISSVLHIDETEKIKENEVSLHYESKNDDSEPEVEPHLESEFEPETVYKKEDEDFFGESEDVDDDGVESKEDEILHEDLSRLKLAELRAIAKSRGIKGFSKMKKSELVELLSCGSDDR